MFKLRGTNTGGKSKYEREIISFARRCSDKNFIIKCIEEGLMKYEIKGDPSEILASFGLSLMKNADTTLKALSHIVSDIRLYYKVPRALELLTELISKFIGSSKLIEISFSQNSPPVMELFNRILESSDCLEAIAIGEILCKNRNRNWLKCYVKNYATHVFTREGCKEAKKKGLELLGHFIHKGEITHKVLKDILGHQKLRIVIMRRGGNVSKVELYIGDDLITSEGTDYIANFLSLTKDLPASSVSVFKN